LLVFSAVYGNYMAVSSPSPIPNMPSMDYQEPNILQTILHYIRGVDPALNGERFVSLGNAPRIQQHPTDRLEESPQHSSV
jgi:hypothetical protein